MCKFIANRWKGEPCLEKLFEASSEILGETKLSEVWGTKLSSDKKFVIKRQTIPFYGQFEDFKKLIDAIKLTQSYKSGHECPHFDDKQGKIKTKNRLVYLETIPELDHESDSERSPKSQLSELEKSDGIDDKNKSTFETKFEYFESFDDSLNF